MMVSIGGPSRVFVDVRGEASSPGLLYVHGGPGQGCYEFMAAQGDRLAESLRVIGLDQRGVLRSDPLSGQSLTLDGLVQDISRLRRRLGIQRWTVVGHSVGALVAVRYAIADPDVVGRLVLDCPCLDVGDSAANLLSRAQHLLGEEGRSELATAAGRAQKLPDPIQRWHALAQIWQDLADTHSRIYFHDPDAAQWFEGVWNGSAITSEQRQRGAAHVAALQADPAFFEPVAPQLSSLTQPTLLIKGAHDPVCTSGQLDVFRDAVSNHRVVELDQSAHFPQIEQADDYAQYLASFASLC